MPGKGGATQDTEKLVWGLCESLIRDYAVLVPDKTPQGLGERPTCWGAERIRTIQELVSQEMESFAVRWVFKY